MTRQIYQRNRGFTLVELLVVITIIAILAGLLTVTIQGVFNRTGVFTVQMDMKKIESALEAFKTKYGFYPPSFKSIMLDRSVSPPRVLDMNNQNDRDIAAANLLPYINRIAPNHSETAVNPDNTNRTFIQSWFDETGRYIAWSKGEDLVFWLSALARNKQYPLTGGFTNGYVAYNGQDVNGNVIEREVFYDFDNSRLVFNPTSRVNNGPERTAAFRQQKGISVPTDLNNDGMDDFVYLDGTAAQFSTSPFLYLDAGSYSPIDPTDPNAGDGGYVRPGTTQQDVIDAQANASLFERIYLKPRSFQLITFGMDGIPRTLDNTPLNPNDWSKVGIDGNDNIVNFAGDGPNTLETMLLGAN